MLDAAGCVVVDVRTQWPATVWVQDAMARLTGTLVGGLVAAVLGFLYFAILPGVLFGFSALAAAVVTESLGLRDHMLAVPVGLLTVALFCLWPYSPLLFQAIVAPRLFGQTLRADGLHVQLGDERLARERTTVEHDGARLTLRTDERTLHLTAGEEQLEWFVGQLDRSRPQAAGQWREVPADVQALRVHDRQE
jgi:hypothetical protein